MQFTSFSVATQAWFDGAFPAATAVQLEAWKAIGSRSHCLVIAPTGSGKTLAAFLHAIDRLLTRAKPIGKTRVLYISPLKALGADVERNLRSPLIGIAHAAARLGLDVGNVSVGVRSGDTTANERRKLISKPPDILITTPESLFLMLTSAAAETLTEVDTVIVDEVHAIADSKRGSHLSLSLARLDALLPVPAQRIGLSATVRPPERIAEFLVGSSPIKVVNPPAAKTFDLTVRVPVPDMTELGDSDTPGSIWPHVDDGIVDLVTAHRSSIVFANSRRLAERLTGRLNEVYAQRLGEPNGQLARAHHGSVSKEQRAIIEDDLKTGRLRCVVATSSLELGIDMGAVDLVVQVESPPSVASGLQRVGRAGHQVGEISKGVLFPKHRLDLVRCTVAVQRMEAGAIESVRIPLNPLDILAQQTVAACALAPINADEWFDCVRSTGSFATLPRSAYDSTLDLLAGKYPSDEFAELRPRIVWDRDSGTVTARPGAQRLAVTSGGAIPDRGLFAVFLMGEKGSRIGELDEEMVYESRVGDIFALGATSWRVEDITHDRVLVSPALGVPGRLPFWHGDNPGRPAEFGAALGEFLRSAKPDSRFPGLDDNAAANLHTLIAEQREATGVVPSDKTLVVERFRDDLGDWRIVLHSPYGLNVHAPWALAVGARILERYGLEVSPSAADDGIIVRLPDTDDDPPGAELFAFEPDEIESIVTAEVTGSALFASRFRECSARALLLPRRDPGRRTPLWQQRQRSAQLLDVARKYSDFPMLLETVRECLHDVYDLAALRDVVTGLSDRRIRLVEVESATPSPFASSLLFEYVGSFIYEGDNPLAERRAAALSLDPQLLAELLGTGELRELLDPLVLTEVEQQLQRTHPDRRARSRESLADVIREIGPLTRDEIADRTDGDSAPWVDELLQARRVLELHHAGVGWLAAVEDASRLRDALGVALPVGTPFAFLEPVADPLGDLVGRYARTHGPFTTADVALRLSLGPAVVESVLHRLEVQRRVVRGEFRPGATGSEWCDSEVLRRIRRRSLAAARAEVEPVPTAAYARFLANWQHVGSQLRGVDGVATVIEQLAGFALPASAWESLVLPQRVADYSPAWLDELTTSGEVLWSGHGAINAKDGWVSFHPADQAPLTLREPVAVELSEIGARAVEALAGSGAFFFRQLTERLSSTDDAALTAALWDLVWAGYVSSDSFGAMRARLAGSARSATTHRAPLRRTNRARGYRIPRVALPSRTGSPTVAGRWSLLPTTDDDPTLMASVTADLLLERYGVVTRGSVVAEEISGGFGAIYKVLTAFEDAGRSRRGYFISGLGGAQFAPGSVVDRLRAVPESTGAIVLAACDPANPYGAALSWPQGLAGPQGNGHRPGRKAGALVVLVDGELTAFVERGGKSLLTFGVPASALARTAEALAHSIQSRLVTGLTIEKVDGASVWEHPMAEFLLRHGFSKHPRGLRRRL